MSLSFCGPEVKATGVLSGLLVLSSPTPLPSPGTLVSFFVDWTSLTGMLALLFVLSCKFLVCLSSSAVVFLAARRLTLLLGSSLEVDWLFLDSLSSTDFERVISLLSSFLDLSDSCLIISDLLLTLVWFLYRYCFLSA